MLKEILSPQTCAQCKVCCMFDKDDCWEMPLLTPDLTEKIKREYPNVNLKKTGVCSVFESNFGEDGLTSCPMLTELGCALGESKPFDCRIWPFRVMKKENLLLLTLSPVCEAVSKLTVSEISAFAEKLSEMVFEEAKRNPEMIKPYIENYPIFSVREAR